MKILYFFPEYETNMFKWQHIHIIAELEKHGVYVETHNPLIYNNPAEANEVFIEKIKNGHYDLMMSSVCYEKMIFPEVLQTAKSLGIPTLCIRWDNLIIPFYDKQMAKMFDLVWLTSWETEYLYKKWGARTIFLPYAANPYSFKYIEQDIIPKVCFIGTPYGSRSLMINTLTTNNIEVDLYSGKNHMQIENSSEPTKIKYDYITPSRWETIIRRFQFKEGRKVMLGTIANKISGSKNVKRNNYLNWYPSCSFEDMILNYSKYALCLSSTSTNNTDALKKPLKVINLRAFEIPMSGGVTICKHNEELGNYFEDGKEIIFYNENKELIDKVRFYTKQENSSLILSMKKAARLRAENEHTWWCRFTKVFEKLNIKYSTNTGNE